jgi:hypothetical protein
MISLPPDFKDILKLFDKYDVKYLLIGGYAVTFYGYIRATGDMDIWTLKEEKNAENIAHSLIEFGFNPPDLSADMFLQDGKIIRMGVPPLRIKILNSISGVSFDDCYKKRVVREIDQIKISIINLEDLKKNKMAAGRKKDLLDHENLPDIYIPDK